MARPKIIDRKSTFITNCKFGSGVVIYPFVTLTNCTICDNVTIYSFSHIQDSIIGQGTQVYFSVIESSNVGKHNRLGPFTHLRPNTSTENRVHLGNFVEVKNSMLCEGVKAGHLAYMGDCHIGAGTNIGCGVIFANYNGILKQKSIVGKNCFIGSNANIVAPCNLADGTYICAGTTMTGDSQPDDFIIGRPYPTVKPGRAKKYRKEK